MFAFNCKEVTRITVARTWSGSSHACFVDTVNLLTGTATFCLSGLHLTVFIKYSDNSLEESKRVASYFCSAPQIPLLRWIENRFTDHSDRNIKCLEATHCNYDCSHPLTC